MVSNDPKPNQPETKMTRPTPPSTSNQIPPTTEHQPSKIVQDRTNPSRTVQHSPEET